MPYRAKMPATTLHIHHTGKGKIPHHSTLLSSPGYPPLNCIWNQIPAPPIIRKKKRKTYRYRQSCKPPSPLGCKTVVMVLFKRPNTNTNTRGGVIRRLAGWERRIADSTKLLFMCARNSQSGSKDSSSVAGSAQRRSKGGMREKMTLKEFQAPRILQITRSRLRSPVGSEVLCRVALSTYRRRAQRLR